MADKAAGKPRPTEVEVDQSTLDEALDEALEETFPASDPVAVVLPKASDSHRWDSPP